MNVTNYTYLINKPDAITEKQTEALGSVLNEFPYFQSARALRLKGLHIQNSFKYNYALKVTAAHTTDRSVLFDFITCETFNAIQGSYYDKRLKELLNITVFDSEIVLVEEKKKQTEVRVDAIERSILDSIKEANNVTFEKPVKIEEQPIEPVAEQVIFTPETSDFIEEIPTEVIPTEVISTIEIAPVIKQPTPTFFDEIVDDEEEEETEKKVDITEEPTKEVSTVIFEELPVPEEPKEIEVPETVKTTEEVPTIEKSPDFSFNETHSFEEWLKLSKTEPIDRTNEVLVVENTESTIKISPEKVDEEKKKKAEIINKFIETNPKIPPIKQTPISPAVQLDPNKEDNSYLMTETLARVYLEQNKYTKAIQAYEILILKYPEKITFFADRISDIKILQQNNNNNN